MTNFEKSCIEALEWRMRMNTWPTWTAFPSQYESLYVNRSEIIVAHIKTALERHNAFTVKCDRCNETSWAVILHTIGTDEIMLLNPSGATSVIRADGTREDICDKCAPEHSDRVLVCHPDAVNDFN